MPDSPPMHRTAAKPTGRLNRTPSTGLQRLLFDASYSLISGKTSGIERVVSNLRREIGSAERAGEIPQSTLISFEGQFFEVDAATERQVQRIAQAQSNIVSALPEFYRRLVVPLAKHCGSRKISKWLAPERGHLGAFSLPYRIWRKRAMRRIFTHAKQIQPGAGDLLILPDAYWTRMDIWPGVAAARERGAFVATVIYDLIPITHPEFVGQRRTEKFRQYIAEVARNSDLILTISETVRRDVEDYFANHLTGGDYCTDIASFPLGAEFSSRTGEIRPEVQRAFAAGPEENPYLMVAAFDPRKNHTYLLDAFDTLWQEGSSRKLCLVGRFGSRCEEVIQRIKQHPRLGAELLVFQDLSDAELHFCYEQSRGVIFPSIVEGFGLPIVESLWHGKPTFASDTPIHREVGGDACRYFDLGSVESLLSCLKSAETRATTIQLEIRPTTWKESAQQFAELCVEHYSRRESEQNLPSPAPLLRSA